MSRRNLWNYDSIDFLKNMPIPVCGAQGCLIHRKDFLELLTRYPSISLKLLEELNRRVSSLEKQGLLLKKGRKITLLDTDALVKMLREE